MIATVDKPLVLVVEDELLIASALEITLDTKGYRVLGPAATVDEARILLETGQPDVALIDYRLASTTTEALLPLLDARGVAVCVLTGYGRKQLPESYAKYAVLEKPFPMQQLVSTLHNLCAIPRHVNTAPR
jgi:DNA-binding NtrC family response regulator